MTYASELALNRVSRSRPIREKHPVYFVVIDYDGAKSVYATWYSVIGGRHTKLITQVSPVMRELAAL